MSKGNSREELLCSHQDLVHRVLRVLTSFRPPGRSMCWMFS